METRIEIHGNEESCAALNSYIEKGALEGVVICRDEGRKNTITLRDAKGFEIQSFKTPLRLGELLDSIDKAKRAGSFATMTKMIEFQNASLDITMGVFKREKEEGVSLTEKEVEILILLHKAKGEMITRQDLLQKIWNYVDAVETHTLETHIYRLRQKIEKTPAQPQILITEENGYRVILKTD